jgi:hypothetical protein
MELYLLKYNQQLIDFKNIHGIDTDDIIDSNMVAIKKMIYTLRKIQTDKLEKEIAEKTMSTIIVQIKDLNQNIKIYLKNKAAQIKEDAKLFQETLLKVTLPFQRKLEAFIQNLQASIKSKERLEGKDKRIMEYLDDLENESIKLKTFKNLTFKNKKEIRAYIVNIISNVQKGVA